MPTYPLGRVPQQLPIGGLGVPLPKKPGAKLEPPTVLTMEEYRTRWEPDGWQLIIIGPTSTWRQEWGEWEAIRDIVQNALDAAEAYKWGYDERGLWISDRGGGVQVADFLLGPPKLKPDWARGKFGEGLKIASLALIRKGYPVYVETKDRELWIVFLEQKVNVGQQKASFANTLAALWRPNGTVKGTTFHIIGYTGPALDNRFAVNLPKSAILWETPSTVVTPIRRYNQLMDARLTEGASIYARDIWMKDIDSPFAYNLWGFPMAPDRHAANNEGDMWTDMGRLWCGVLSIDLLEKFLQMMQDPPLIKSEESRKIQMGVWEMGTEPTSGKHYADLVKDNASYWQRAWRNVFGDAVVIRTTDRWDGMVKHLGYASINLHWEVRATLARAITTDADLVKTSQEKLREVEAIPDEQLSPRVLAHLKLARAMAHYFAAVAGVHASIIPPASDRVRTAGLYDRTTQEIFIHLEVLERASGTTDAVIHELGHHVASQRVSDPTKAEDLQEPHSAAMTEVAARVVRLTADRKFDELLREAVW